MNSFVSDTEEELEVVRQCCEKNECTFAPANVWGDGGNGGVSLAKAVLETLETKESHFAPIYDTNASLKEKIETVAKEIYGARGVTYLPSVEKQIAKLEQLGFGNMPVCMAKTQYSLSDNPDLLGRPEDFEITVRDMYVSAGAGFVVVLTGNVMTMPGLPKVPAANRIDVNEQGVIEGLF